MKLKNLESKLETLMKHQRECKKKMEELKLENLIEKIPNKNCCIIVIEDDLTETMYRIEESRNIKDLIREKNGFCFKFNNDKYFFWEYSYPKQIYYYYEEEGRQDFYLHDKLKADLNILRISGEKYREEK